VASTRERKGAYRVLILKLEGKGDLEDLGVNGEQLNVNLQDIIGEDVGWIDRVQDRGKW
jgi:hypothetical protein